MRKALLAVLLAGCTAHNQALERKVDDLAVRLSATERQLAELRGRLDQAPIDAGPAPTEGSGRLERRVDELDKKIDRIGTIAAAPPARPARREPDRSKVYAVKVDGFPSDGPADALVTLVIAHDYADPFSNKNRATLDELRKKYSKDLRIVFRNMVVHPRNAMAAALGSCAAHKQGKFDVLEDLLWERGFQQRQLDVSDVDTGSGSAHCWDTAEGCTIVLGFAKEAGLKLDRFKADMKRCEAEVAADQRELQAFGVGATPSFFINGRFMSGAFPTDNFVTLVDEELGKAKDRTKKGTARGKYYKKWVLEKGLAQLEP